ncbi:alpha/beta hydrolase family protein [Pelagibius sp.]|uniref:alpha/beta hydrolase family protein n=1 Tax=Pelagibius sp. TaxID=1931238 RepID=UPI003B5089B0
MTAIDSRLPMPSRNPLDWDPLGNLVMRPWYDRCALHLVARWYLPLSRAWAAALTYGEDEDRFAEAVGLDRFPDGWTGRRLRRAIAGALRQRQRHAVADDHWRSAFFGQAVPLDRELVEAEQTRIAAANALMATRFGFLGIRGRSHAVAWQVPAPPDQDHLAAQRGSAGTCIAALLDGEAALPEVEASHPVPGPFGQERWLRFASPGLDGDTAWARVFEPEDAEGAPTFINLHGIGMELDFWKGTIDHTASLTRQGLRVIRPEGPWHGRRRRAGFYGGEPAMALGPEGFRQLFAAWGADVAVLVDWARRNGSGRVALGGVSLGALTSQLTAVAAAAWPERLRPDALILVATSGDLLDIALGGSLSQAVGFGSALHRAGWSDADLSRYVPLLEPRGAPVMPPERIVIALGEADTVTPFAGGLALARRWAVPPENLFIRRQGHFSVSLDLSRQPQPLNRLIEILTRS